MVGLANDERCLIHDLCVKKQYMGPEIIMKMLLNKRARE